MLRRGERGTSHVPELYYQHTSYRLQKLEERTREWQRRVGLRHDWQRDFELEEMRKFLAEQREYIDGLLMDLDWVES